MTDQVLLCANCKAVIEIGEDVGLVGKSNIPEEMHIVCLKCHEAQDFPNIPELARASTRFELKGPLSGRFRPCKANDVIIEERQKSFEKPRWDQLERDTLDMLHEWGNRFNGLTLSGRTYRGYDISFEWSDQKIVALGFPGKSTKLFPPMDIYRVHRLRGMGLEGSGVNPTHWTIALDGPEAEFENVARIISHVLCYGYLLDFSRIDQITPNLETRDS